MRAIVPGQPVHVTQRGNNRGQVFFTPKDGAYYLEWLAEAAGKCRVAIHAYVLMTNHLHILATPQYEDSLGRMMLSVGTRYTRYINATQNRTGTLWEGRYRSSLITSDAYLLACMRYIETNPVRLGLAPDPSVFRWSSYKRNGLGRADALITPHPLYDALGSSDEARAAAYHALASAPLDAPTLANIRNATDWGVAMTESVTEPKRGRPKRPVVGAATTSAKN